MQAINIYADKVQELRNKLGKDIIIMGHHYQHDDVIAHVDIAGDSLQLSQMMEGIEAKHIVFCGVHFMAESACLLAKEGQHVYLPDETASCLMAEMTPADLLATVIKKIKDSGKNIIPLAYVNTSLAVKAVVGKHGGAVCTSSNAKAMLEWAYTQGDCVLFLPDQNLGNNVANMIGIDEAKRHALDVKNNGDSLDFETIQKSSLLFWPGCCPIHEYFTTKHVEEMREAYPDAKIYVHPECPQELVKLCDGAGSTSYLIKVAEDAEIGSTIIIGTEVNLVDRLTKQLKGKVNVLPLFRAECPDMAKVTEALLYKTLDNIDKGLASPVQIDKSYIEDGKQSLVRMLEHCSKLKK